MGKDCDSVISVFKVFGPGKTLLLPRLHSAKLSTSSTSGGGSRIGHVYDEFADLSENGAPHFRSGGGDDERQPRSAYRNHQSFWPCQYFITWKWSFRDSARRLQPAAEHAGRRPQSRCGSRSGGGGDERRRRQEAQSPAESTVWNTRALAQKCV